MRRQRAAPVCRARRLFEAGVIGRQVLYVRIGERRHEGHHQRLLAAAILEGLQLFHQIGGVLPSQMGIPLEVASFNDDVELLAQQMKAVELRLARFEQQVA